jgi:hypothetical protein
MFGDFKIDENCVVCNRVLNCTNCVLENVSNCIPDLMPSIYVNASYLCTIFKVCTLSLLDPPRKNKHNGKPSCDGI